MTEKTRVLLVDDHKVVRLGLRMAISGFASCEVVAEAASGEEAVALCGSLHPDLVLMDIKMEGMGGAHATKLIRRTYPDIFVIVLSSFADKLVVQEMDQAGVSGFLLKDFDPDFLERAIADVILGERVFSPAISPGLTTEPAENTPDFGLGPQQKKVLFLMSKGLTNKEISAHIGVSVATARYHVSAILNKLSVSNRAEAAALAIAKNLVD